MIQTNGRNHRDGRTADHIGGIKPSAQTHFQNQRIGGVSREGKESGSGGDFKECDRCAAICDLAFLEHIAQLLFRNQRTGEADALMEMDEVRRGVDMHAQILRFEHCAGKGAGGTFPVGAGYVDHGRQLFFRMAKIHEQSLDAVQNKVYALRVELKQPFEDSVAPNGDAHAAPSACALTSVTDGATAEEASARALDCLVSNCTKCDNVSRI